MIVTWTVEGVDWSENIKANINSDPSEIATKGVEQAVESLKNSEDGIQFGAILRIFHNKMKNENEHLFVFAPHILANAGYYADAEQLKKAAQQEFIE
jgi:hypothetical protein